MCSRFPKCLLGSWSPVGHGFLAVPTSTSDDALLLQKLVGIAPEEKEVGLLSGPLLTWIMLRLRHFFSGTEPAAWTNWITADGEIPPLPLDVPAAGCFCAPISANFSFVDALEHVTLLARTKLHLDSSVDLPYRILPIGPITVSSPSILLNFES
ncbi:hypothetical protein VNO78_26596 [Psophocarpus tetragonolobus]|uniref:Uncharacterized protein n=1 Tax=Psophocarpus tetragonolobus TaxID=3891 RepID=A0AAN9S023_PSOTE